MKEVKLLFSISTPSSNNINSIPKRRTPTKKEDIKSTNQPIENDQPKKSKHAIKIKKKIQDNSKEGISKMNKAKCQKK